MSPLLVVLLALVAALLAFRGAKYYHSTVWRWHQMTKHVPGPPTWPLVGSALSLAIHPDKLFVQMLYLWRTYGSTIRLWLGPEVFLVLTEPDDVEVSLRAGAPRNESWSTDSGACCVRDFQNVLLILRCCRCSARTRCCRRSPCTTTS